jgi:bifunctional non-homologous end joining protein LigD
VAVADVPAGPEWEYELKFDGYRAIAFKTRNRVHLRSRNGKDFSHRFPALVHALEPLADETVIDGEIVALDGTGRPSFNLLENYATREYSLVLYVFDLLVLAGKDLRNEPLDVRRKLLHARVMSRLAEPIRFSEPFVLLARNLFERCASRALRA